MAGPVLTGESIEEETRLRDTLAKIKHVIIVISGKGGVGKSTVSSNIAMSLSMRGYNTGLMDIDITGPNIPKMFGIEDEQLMANENRMLIPIIVPPSLNVMSMAFLLPSKDTPVLWRGPVKMSAVQQFIEDVNWGELDYLIVDMPPGTGDVPLTVFQSLPIDGIVIVTSPQDLVSLIVEKAVRMAAMMNIPVLGVVMNMSYLECPHCGKKIYPFGQNDDDIAKKYGFPAIEHLPIDPKLATLCDKGAIENYEGRYLGELTKLIHSLEK